MVSIFQNALDLLKGITILGNDFSSILNPK